MKTDSQKPEKPIDVTLDMPHTHAGIDYEIGETITVSPSQCAWLQQRGIVADETTTKTGE